MSITVNAALLQSQFQDGDISDENAEVVLDGAINLLNVYGAGLSNLSGDAGSKSGSYSTEHTGAIMTMSQQIYAKHFKNAANANVNVGGLGLSYSSDMHLLRFAKALAWQLKGRSFERT